MESKRIRLLVSGRVTGVGFRYATVGVARNLNLVGEVKNTSDQSVEIIAEGNQDNLDKLYEWAKTGPALANVVDIKIFNEAPTGNYSDFRIRK